MAKAKWIIAVAPPARYGEPFDIPEWSYTHACQTARRYRQRGWRARARSSRSERSEHE